MSGLDCWVGNCCCEEEETGEKGERNGRDPRRKQTKWISMEGGRMDTETKGECLAPSLLPSLCVYFGSRR